MASIFFVVVDVAAHTGHIVEEEADNIWRRNDNEEGWTYNEVEGMHGRIWEECSTQDAAQTELDEFLECNALETGRRCFTHNPNPQ